MTNISAQQLSQWLADPSRPQPLLLDVREPWEWEICRIANSTHVPMRTIPTRFGELAADGPTVVICHHGGRSMQVAHFLEHQGFDQVFNLAGGVNAWSMTVDPAMPRY